MRRLSRTLLFSLLLAAGSGLIQAGGFGYPDAGYGGRLLLARGYSLDDAVSGVRRRNTGRVLSADTVQQDGRPVHRIRVLSDQGRVRGLRFDGNTGKPLSRALSDQRRPRRR